MIRYTNTLTVLLLLIFLASSASASEFQILDFAEDPMDMRGTVRAYRDMNADPCAVLRVESDVPGDLNLTDVQVYHRDKESAGVYYFYVSSWERHVTFVSEGYLPLTYKIPQQLAKGKVYIVRIKSGGGLIEENRPTIRLNFELSEGEVVIGDIDGKVAPIDFASGYMNFRPSSGEHIIRLNSGGRIWEKMFDLEPGQAVEENVLFPDTRTEAWDLKAPGKLYIDSEPQGATVYLNQAERGKTPITIKDLQPGSYQVEVNLELYLPNSKTFDVKSLDYTQETFKLVPNFGKLIIDSDPQDAIVWINGRQSGNTRFERAQFSVGSYELKLSKPLYHDTTMTFEIGVDGEFIRTFKLKPQFGMVSIKSDPSEALVTVDGENWGLTPIMKRDEVLSGEHVVRLEKEFYFSEQTTITVEDGKHSERDFQLRSSVSWLSVDTDPKDAKVTLINSKEKPRLTPIKDWKLDPGIYNLRIEKDLYEVYETAISLALGDKKELRPELIRKTGHLDVASEPQGAKIFLNGKNSGEVTPKVLRDLPTGEYTLELRKEGYDIQINQVVVRHKEVTEYSRTLGTTGTKEWKKRRLQARLLSVAVPGGGQYLSKQYRSVIYAGGFLTALYMTYDATQEHLDQKSRYNSEQEAYLLASTQEAFDEHFTNMNNAIESMNDAQSKADTYLYSAIGIYGLQLLDAWFFGGGPKPVSRGNNLGANMEFSPFVSSGIGQGEVGIKIYFNCVNR